MSSPSTARATIEDLLREEGKAELIDGRIVCFMASGDLPSSVALEIAVSLRAYARATGKGRAYAGGIGYVVPELPSGRESFSPDASYYVGPGQPHALPRRRAGSRGRGARRERLRAGGRSGDGRQANRLFRCRDAGRLGRRSVGRDRHRPPGERSEPARCLPPWRHRRSGARRPRLADAGGRYVCRATRSGFRAAAACAVDSVAITP
jgi:hypothetical protein